jgi:peptide-methionine (S)-S-oxide reductase
MRSRSLLLVVATLAPLACAGPSLAAQDLPAPKQDLPAKDKAPRTAVFAAGCFWCAEGAFERIEGVTDVVSGYAGGTAETANYEQVGSGSTGHAESVRVTYDPSRVTYGQLLQVLFTFSDPTTKDRQGPDWGHQYRSAIFYQNEGEHAVAAAYIKQLEEAKAFAAPIVTTLEPLTAFYPAEAYHQDYVRRHPDHPYVRAWFPAKLHKLQEHLPKLLKASARAERL